jgi:hypothetical protein
VTPVETAEVATAGEVLAWGRAEIGARAGLATPDVGITRTLSLPRARVEAGLATEGPEAQALGRVVLAAVRSGGETGYIGVDGESLVTVVQVAEAAAAWPALGLSVAGGVVDDPWVRSGDALWGLRAVAPGMGEDLGWMEPSDVGAWAGWAAREGRVRARATLSAGEGARMRERNDGKDLSLLVSVQPRGEHRGGLLAQAYAREGSRGLGSAPDHRAGARLGWESARLRGGAEVLAAWGVGGNATRTPAGASAWLVARPLAPLMIWGRLDLSTEDPGDADAATRILHAGVAHPLFPDARARLSLGVSHRAVGSAVRSVAGAEALATQAQVYAQIDLDLDTRGTNATPFRTDPP